MQGRINLPCILPINARIYDRKDMKIMKAKSIVAIKEILEQRVKSASYQYKTRKYNLEQKYGWSWSDFEFDIDLNFN